MHIIIIPYEFDFFNIYTVFLYKTPKKLATGNLFFNDSCPLGVRVPDDMFTHIQKTPKAKALSVFWYTIRDSNPGHPD